LSPIGQAVDFPYLLKGSLKARKTRKPTKKIGLSAYIAQRSSGLRVFLPFALALAIAFVNSSATCLSKALKNSPEALIPFKRVRTADLTTNAIFIHTPMLKEKPAKIGHKAHFD
jgi:hypothetical protein